METLLVAVSPNVIAPLQLTGGLVNRVKVARAGTDEHCVPHDRGVEKTQPPVSYFQRSSGPTAAEETAALLSELVAQLTAAITTTMNAEMKLRLFLLAALQQDLCKRLFTE